MIKIRRSEERGIGNHGWLNSYHTFSFSDYYDPAWMGFRSLRVINEDRVAPGQGFQTHAHADMEILSYVLEGSLAHQDSLGNGSIIKPGDVQRMTAGTGVNHSEFNHSKSEWVHFLQIWILPAQKNLPPSYEQLHFSPQDRQNRWCLIASQTGEHGSVTIHQDAKIFSAILDSQQALIYLLPKHRHAWLQIARGSLSTNSKTLTAGDAVSFIDVEKIELMGIQQAEMLLFDLA